jgi:hypothetical protein
MPAATDVQPFPAGVRTEDIQTNGTTLYVRIGGHGPAVILLLRIPRKPAGHSKRKPATNSDLKPAGVPI